MPRKDIRRPSRTLAARAVRLLLLTLSCLSPAAFLKAQPRPDDPAPPAAAPVIAVAPRESGGVTVFWADAESGTIYSKQVTGSPAAETPLKEFAVFFRSPELTAPSALAYHDGKLFVCDAKAAALYEIDVESGKHRVLLTAPALTEPTAVIVSEQGAVAVIDSGREQVVWYRPGEEPRVESIHGAMVRGLTGRRAETANFNPPITEHLWAGVPRLPRPSSDKSVGKGIGALTHYRGIYYLASERGVLAFARNGSFTLPLSHAAAAPGATRLAASEYHLFLADGARKTLVTVPRPVPVRVSFESVSGSSTEETASAHQGALASLYLYLASRGVLPTRTYTAPHDLPNLYTALVKQKVIFPASDESGRSDSLTPQAREKLTRLMCELNRELCAASAWPREFLSQRVRSGRRITLPDVGFASDLISSSVDLKGKSVKDHLKERVSAAQRKKIDHKGLLQLNASFKNTLEGFLSGKQYILADALKAELQPGSVIRFDKGQEVKVTDVRKCGPELVRAVSEAGVKPPPSLTSRAVEAVLPWRSGRTPEAAGELRKLGVAEVEVSFDKLTSERLSFTAFQESQMALYERRCLEFKAKRYVVAKALKAAGTRYTLRRGDGSPVSLGAEELRRLNLLGEPDPAGESSFVVEEPLYIGYQLLWADDDDYNFASDARWRQIDDYRDVKPDSPQSIFNQTRGVFELPATRWRASLFVPAEDLKVESALRQATAARGIYVFSEQESALKAHGLAASARAPQEAGTLADIRRYREQLKERIRYIPPGDDASDIRIGIGEDEKSVDFNHPDFYDERGNAWHRLTEDKQSHTKVWTPVPKPAAAGAPPPAVKDFSEKDDHGSHVAGLLAARKTTVPGLLPDAELFLIDHGSVADFEDAVEEAIKRGIYIFNFSFTTKVQGDDTFIDIKKKMKTEPRWRQRLFVVASGNDNHDLSHLPERFPISWATSEANILGVGASDGNNNFLGQWTPDPKRPDHVMRGSNWGKEYVHLLAPGKEIWSTASGNKYAVATGSSMAVPQVTAAAAVLFNQGVGESVWIKLRLIYTADWFSPQFDDKVWGGQLNYRRAVWQHSHNLLSTQSSPTEYSSVEFDERAEIEVRRGKIDDRRDEPAPLPKKILLKNVLRIQRLGQPASGLFNVVYLEDTGGKKLRILRNAEISGSLACRSMRRWDAAANGFQRKPQDCEVMDASSSFYDYVGRVPRERHDVVLF